MNDGEKALRDVLTLLHAAEHNLELANALTPTDHRINDAEIALHTCIGTIDRIVRGEHAPRCTGVLVHSEFERCPRCDS